MIRSHIRSLETLLTLILTAICLPICLQAQDYEYTITNGEVTITEYIGDLYIGELAIPEEIEGFPVTAIGDWAFWVEDPEDGDDWWGPDSLTVPDSVTTIGTGAFWGWRDTKIVTIPVSVTFIGDEAFATEPYRGSLTSIYFMGEPPTLGSNVFLGKHNELVIYYVQGTPGWGATFGGIPAAPFTPWGKYIVITSEPYTCVETGDWMGILEVTHAPWVWCYDTDSWLYIPEEVAESGRGWIYDPLIMEVENMEGPGLQLSQLLDYYGTDVVQWAYSYALNKHFYIHPSWDGWICLVE